MKKIRIFSILLFLAAAVVFVLYLFVSRQRQDDQGPEITMDSETIRISVQDDMDAILDGVTAIDRRDGDVTDLLLVEKLTNFVDSGRRQATIAAFDIAGNVSKVVRDVVYTDYMSPEFALESPFSFAAGISDITRYLTVQDCMDGNLTSKIKLSSQEGIATNIPGFYDAVFTVSNSAGDTVKLPVTVEIYNTSERSRQPVILLNEYLVYVEKGADLDPTEYIQEIYFGNRSYVRGNDGLLHYDGNSRPESLAAAIDTDDVTIDNPVDTSVPGVYEVVYRYTWDDDYMPGSVRLIVVVTK